MDRRFNNPVISCKTRCHVVIVQDEILDGVNSGQKLCCLKDISRLTCRRSILNCYSKPYGIQVPDRESTTWIYILPATMRY